jgi:murein DD-endopeptidase MepM/ murein hydrolase activator NlpD
MQKRSRFFSVLIVPEGGSKTIHFKLRSLTFKILVLTVLIFIVGAVVSIFLTGRIAAKIQLVNYLAKQNDQLKEETSKMQLLANELIEIKERENKIRILASTFMGKDVLSGKKEEKDLLYHKDVIDDFVLQVSRKQKALELATSEGEATRQERMLAAVPTLRPLGGWITRGFTAFGSENIQHKGIDIAAASGTTILSAASGLVTFSGWDKLFGNLLIINHGFGYETRYGHCERLLAKKGDLVKRGQAVATVGNSGRSTAPHLHYEILKNGTAMDPLLFFVH